MIALIGSLGLFVLFAGAEQFVYHFEVALVEHVTPMGGTVVARAPWLEELLTAFESMERFALAGVALSLFDRVAAWRLSLGSALSPNSTMPDILRAAVVVGWCIIASTILNAFA